MEIDMETMKMYFAEMPKNLVLQLILFFIILDILTGISKAFKFKKLNSSFGIQGLGKHITFIFAIIFATYILQAIKLNSVLYAIYIIYFIFYATSICENCYQLNWKIIPEFVLKRLLVYQEAINQGKLSVIFKQLNNIKKGDLSTEDIEEKTTLTKEESEILKDLLEKAEITEEVKKGVNEK